MSVEAIGKLNWRSLLEMWKWNEGPWWGPMKAFCGYVNADGVGIVLAGGGDT